MGEAGSLRPGFFFCLNIPGRGLPMSAAGPDNPVHTRLNAELRALLTSASPAAALDLVMQHFACPVGSIHRLDSATGLLILIERRGIPDAILPAIERIPIGKGMAGLAAERRTPVTVCNLQTDESGQVRPSAKATGMEGAIAVPMLVEGSVKGVLGIAMPTAHEFSADDQLLLTQIAAEFGERLG